jgi:hypothetical protein
VLGKFGLCLVLRRLAWLSRADPEPVQAPAWLSRAEPETGSARLSSAHGSEPVQEPPSQKNLQVTFLVSQALLSTFLALVLQSNYSDTSVASAMAAVTIAWLLRRVLCCSALLPILPCRAASHRCPSCRVSRCRALPAVVLCHAAARCCLLCCALLPILPHVVTLHAAATHRAMRRIATRCCVSCCVLHCCALQPVAPCIAPPCAAAHRPTRRATTHCRVSRRRALQPVEQCVVLLHRMCLQTELEG